MRRLASTPERRLLLALLLTRLPFAFFLHGTEDVTGWAAIGRALVAGENPYATGYVNWPPLWPLFAAAAHGIANLTPLAFSFVIKLAPIAADVVIAFVLFARAGSRIALVYALNPIAIYVTSIHGQFDSLPALCALLAVTDSERQGSEKRSASWLSIGVMFKTWPLFLLPALVARSRRRLLMFAIAVIPLLLVMSVVYVIDPEPIQQRVISYRGFPAWWGLGSFPTLFGERAMFPSPEQIRQIFYAAMGIVAVMIFVAAPSAARGALLIALTFLLFTPGFGLQYLLWIVPIGLIADPKRTLIYSAIAGVAILIETLFRPFNGSIGDVVRVLPHSGFARDYGGSRDHFWTLVDRLPVWLFVAYWWTATLVAIRHREAARPSATLSAL